jgi:hypothetical protein
MCSCGNRWLRHEVPMNMDEDDRVSVSFNYRWE